MLRNAERTRSPSHAREEEQLLLPGDAAVTGLLRGLVAEELGGLELRLHVHLIDGGLRLVRVKQLPSVGLQTLWE